jgi:hypothetical protein
MMQLIKATVIFATSSTSTASSIANLSPFLMLQAKGIILVSGRL